jgi:hypothetical protein
MSKPILLLRLNRRNLPPEIVDNAIEQLRDTLTFEGIIQDYYILMSAEVFPTGDDRNLELEIHSVNNVDKTTIEQLQEHLNKVIENE